MNLKQFLAMPVIAAVLATAPVYAAAPIDTQHFVATPDSNTFADLVGKAAPAELPADFAAATNTKFKLLAPESQDAYKRLSIATNALSKFVDAFFTKSNAEGTFPVALAPDVPVQHFTAQPKFVKYLKNDNKALLTAALEEAKKNAQILADRDGEIDGLSFAKLTEFFGEISKGDSNKGLNNLLMLTHNIAGFMQGLPVITGGYRALTTLIESGQALATAIEATKGIPLDFKVPQTVADFKRLLTEGAHLEQGKSDVLLDGVAVPADVQRIPGEATPVAAMAKFAQTFITELAARKVAFDALVGVEGYEEYLPFADVATKADLGKVKTAADLSDIKKAVEKAKAFVEAKVTAVKRPLEQQIADAAAAPKLGAPSLAKLNELVKALGGNELDEITDTSIQGIDVLSPAEIGGIVLQGSTTAEALFRSIKAMMGSSPFAKQATVLLATDLGVMPKAGPAAASQAGNQPPKSRIETPKAQALAQAGALGEQLFHKGLISQGINPVIAEQILAKLPQTATVAKKTAVQQDGCFVWLNTGSNIADQDVVKFLRFMAAAK